MKTATIFNIQRFSLHDGPGIRTTVFVKGCPLHCTWCHNPESMAAGPEPLVTAHHCIGCAACLPVCPEELTGRLDLAGGPTHPGAECLRCGACVDACPTGARDLVGLDWSCTELLAELQRDAFYHVASTGGVTFSGGEPLSPANAPFVLTCLEALAGRGTHTAVDTCGHVPTEPLLAAARWADLILYDLKLMDPDRHAAATGQDNTLILHNLATLLDQDCQVWLRVPLIPGQNTDPANLLAMAEFLRQQRRTPPVYLLPYHATGRDKYPRLGRSSALPETPALAETEAEACADVLQDRGLCVQVGG